MNIARPTPLMTRAQFLDWAEAQPVRYEFDGAVPVAMTGGTRNHSLICQNIYAALRGRLKATPCTVLGPDAGLATIGDAVRYPDALITCTKGSGTDKLIAGAIVVFEVVSATSGRIDRIDKLQEYRSVATVRRYFILESNRAAISVYARADSQGNWTETALTGEQVLSIPELGIDVPVGEFYEDTDLMIIA